MDRALVAPTDPDRVPESDVGGAEQLLVLEDDADQPRRGVGADRDLRDHAGGAAMPVELAQELLGGGRRHAPRRPGHPPHRSERSPSRFPGEVLSMMSATIVPFVVPSIGRERDLAAGHVAEAALAAHGAGVQERHPREATELRRQMSVPAAVWMRTVLPFANSSPQVTVSRSTSSKSAVIAPTSNISYVTPGMLSTRTPLSIAALTPAE